MAVEMVSGNLIAKQSNFQMVGIPLSESGNR